VWKTDSEESPSNQNPSRPREERSTTSANSQRVASLGPSLVIRGTLSGQEDLLIEGQVEGEISLRKHSVTVGPKGRVKADIFSKSICVEGEVQGNLFGEDQVTIRRSGKVKGNVTSPRVTLEDGSKFKGAIDMKPPPAVEAETPPTKSRQPKSQQAPHATSTSTDEQKGRAVSAKSADG